MSLAIVPLVQGARPARNDPGRRAAKAHDALLRMVRVQSGWLDHHIPSLPEVARSLAVSERTLRRYLRSLDTSYTEILQQVRQELSQQALIHSDLTVEEIAAKLGYSETTNFRHAFRRWAGCSPQAYRTQGRRYLHKEPIDAAA